MNIIVNHTLRSVRGNVGQSFVIVITVAVATLLFFAALILGDLFYNFQYANLSRLCGDADVSIDGDVFSGKKLDEFLASRTDVSYTDEYLRMGGLINAGEDDGKSTAVLIEATDLNVFVARHKDKLSFYKGIGSSDYVYPEIWISRALADEKNYDVGSEVEIYLSLYRRYETFTVTYIFENDGVFANTTVYNILTDTESIGASGIYSTAYIKLNGGADKDAFISDLTAYMNNPELEIGCAVDYEYINNLVSDNESLLDIVLVFVTALVVFILFGSYLVVAQNRANELIVFKSAGATPAQTIIILLSEGLLYGIVGAAIGLIAGRFSMQIVVMSVIPDFTDAVTYKVGDYIAAFLSGVLVSLASALIPMIKLTKNSVNSLYSSGVKSVKKASPYLFVPAAAVAAACVAVIIFVPKLMFPFTVLLIVSVTALSVISAPYLTELVSSVFKRTRGPSNLASSSVKRNFNAVSLSGVLGAVIAFAFVTVSIVNIIIDASKPFNSRFSADCAVQTVSSSTDMEAVNNEIAATYGVKYSYLFRYETFDVNFNGDDTELYVYAVDNADALDCVTNLTTKQKEIFDNDEKSIVVSYDILNRLGLKTGGKATFELDGEKYEFDVIAVDETVTSTDRIIYVNSEYCGSGFENSVIFLGTDKNVSNTDLYNDLRKKLADKNCYILQFDDWAYATSVGVSGIGELLKWLEGVVCAVSFIGIVNLTIALILGRRREFEIYRSVGLDGKSYFRLLLCESLVISCTGGAIGLVFSLVVNLLIPKFAALIDRYITVSPFPASIAIITVSVIALYAAVYCAVGAHYRMDKIKAGDIRNV
jgi:putative ABC transport system permease protein